MHRWAILRAPLLCPIAKVPPLVESLIRLHNFCIDMREDSNCNVMSRNRINISYNAGHSKINLVPTEDNMMETLTVTEDEITSLIEDTADIKLINSVGKKTKKSKKDTRVLNL